MVGTVNDIFDVLANTSLKKSDLVAIMAEILNVLEENMVLDGEAGELDECNGIHNSLDAAIQKYYEDMAYGEDDDNEEEPDDYDND